MKLFRLEWIVLVAAFTILSWNLWNVGIASGYIDPLLHFGAQDEATYTRQAITMSRDGGWMTPDFLGRWVFEKPPLLMWLSAISMKVFGVGRMSARVPAVLAGALICVLCFFMVRRRRSVPAALVTAAMALSSQILFTMSRHNMTDILFGAAGMCAFSIVLSDPELLNTSSLAGFVIAAAAGIMAKSVAGILVLAVMGVVVGFGNKRHRASSTRAALAAGLTLVLASPWFLYNMILHRDWFLADMGFQLITIGTAAHQTSSENHVWFYVVRILTSDLVPLLMALAAVPALVRAVRNREAPGLLAASYFAVYFAALMVFRFHSEQYLCWFIPSLILIAGLYSPLLNKKSAYVMIAVVSAAFAIKLANPDRDFGISIRQGSTIAAVPALSQYCAEHRATDLYILGVDDEFYSAVLPLHRVRYGWIDSTDLVAREHPHLAYLGILIPADDLKHLDQKLPLFRDRLRAWGLDSTRAVATGLSAHDVDELLQIIRDHPDNDFLVARSILPNSDQAPSHRVVIANSDFILLETRSPVGSEAAGWSCAM
jgi:4-amino-4-deoxy-L-arabinose transferase-like glycosyltransferase